MSGSTTKSQGYDGLKLIVGVARCHPLVSCYNTDKRNTHRTTYKTMNNSPIDFLLAFLLFSFESACWFINEFAGFHDAKYHFEKAKKKAVFTFVAACEKADAMTKRQLQALTGLKSNRYSKADLISEAVKEDTAKILAFFAANRCYC